MDGLYSIIEIAERLNISVSTIRKYEKDYRLNIMRNESNNRVYTNKDLEVLKKIVDLKSEGANIHLIRKILAKEELIPGVPDAIEENKLAVYTIDPLLQQLKNEFEIILDKKLEEQEKRIREQIKAENKKLIDYIETTRQEKTSIWGKIFKK